MKTQLGITFKFLIPVIVVFAIIAGFLSYQASGLVKQIQINQASSLVVDFVQIQAKNHLTSSSIFSLDNPEQTEQAFNEVLREVSTRDILKIKVWDKNATVIFSNDKTIVGKRFDDNEEFKEAMAGKPEVEIKEPLSAENVGEKGYRQLMEVYVPITLAGESNVTGVIETYYKLDTLNEQIKKAQMKIIAVNAGAFLILAVIIWILFKFLVIRPLEMLESGMEEIKKKGV